MLNKSPKFENTHKMSLWNLIIIKLTKIGFNFLFKKLSKPFSIEKGHDGSKNDDLRNMTQGLKLKLTMLTLKISFDHKMDSQWKVDGNKRNLNCFYTIFSKKYNS